MNSQSFPSQTDLKKTTVMRQAWAAAKSAALRFGGRASDFIAEAIRQAWAAVLADPVIKEVCKMIREIRARRLAGWVAPRGRNNGCTVNCCW